MMWNVLLLASFLWQLLLSHIGLDYDFIECFIQKLKLLHVKDASKVHAFIARGLNLQRETHLFN